MSYTQRFGLSRKSPFNNVDETDKKDTAKQQAVSKTPSNDVFGELEYKTQSERGMSDSEYRDQYEMGNIHNPALDGVIMRSGVDYDAFYKKHGEDADFEEHMKKNLGDDLYKRSLAENFTKDPYYKDIMRRGLEGRSDYSSFSKIMPSGEVDVSKVADNVQEGLDYAGMLFPPADLVNMGISGIRAGGSLLSGDMQGFKKHSKRGVKSAVSTVPIFGDTFAAGTKLAKLNKFGKSKGTIYKPGMFKPESMQRNVARGVTNFALRKGKDTKFSSNVQKGLQTVLGTSKPAQFVSKKTTENFLSGKPIIKTALSDKKENEKES